MAVTITQEEIRKAKSYMPLARKYAIAKLMAKLCVRIVPNDASTAENPLPELRVEDRMMRQQCLMGVLAGWYLERSFPLQEMEIQREKGETEIAPINFCMSVEALDEFCESHPMNQLERMKREKAVANKVYDILYDFKGFEAFLNGAIRDELEMQNDPALRMAQMMAVQTTPESLRKTLEAITEYKEKLEAKDDA